MTETIANPADDELPRGGRIVVASILCAVVLLISGALIAYLAPIIATAYQDGYAPLWECVLFFALIACLVAEGLWIGAREMIAAIRASAGTGGSRRR